METSGRFWSPLNLKALTKTSQVLPNTSWHGLREKKKHRIWEGANFFFTTVRCIREDVQLCRHDERVSKHNMQHLPSMPLLHISYHCGLRHTVNLESVLQDVLVKDLNYPCQILGVRNGIIIMMMYWLRGSWTHHTAANTWNTLCGVISQQSINGKTFGHFHTARQVSQPLPPYLFLSVLKHLGSGLGIPKFKFQFSDDSLFDLRCPVPLWVPVSPKVRRLPGRKEEALPHCLLMMGLPRRNDFIY